MRTSVPDGDRIDKKNRRLRHFDVFRFDQTVEDIAGSVVSELGSNLTLEDPGYSTLSQKSENPHQCLAATGVATGTSHITYAAWGNVVHT